MRSLRRRVLEYDVERWSRDFLTALAEARRDGTAGEG
jgi:trehalose-6-phosphate synthase